MELIKEEALLRKPCSPISVSKGLKLGREMHNFLSRLNKSGKERGVGLSAPQVGVYSQVFIMNVNNQPMTFINPRIVAHSTVQIPYVEGCLSFGGKQVNTFRWPWVTVDCDNWSKDITFGLFRPNLIPAHECDFSLLKAVVCQHEWDHLHQILFTDRTKDLTESYEGIRLDMTDANPGNWRENV